MDKIFDLSDTQKMTCLIGPIWVSTKTGTKQWQVYRSYRFKSWFLVLLKCFSIILQWIFVLRMYLNLSIRVREVKEVSKLDKQLIAFICESCIINVNTIFTCWVSSCSAARRLNLDVQGNAVVRGKFGWMYISISRHFPQRSRLSLSHNAFSSAYTGRSSRTATASKSAQQAIRV